MPFSFAVDDKNTGIFRIDLHVCRMFGEDHRLDLFELSVDNGNCGCIWIFTADLTGEKCMGKILRHPCI